MTEPRSPHRQREPSQVAQLSAIAQIPDLWRSDVRAARVVSGRLCTLHVYLYTVGLCVGVRFDELSLSVDARYCYESWADAVVALASWDGAGDPPGAWIKEKMSGRLGPGIHDE